MKPEDVEKLFEGIPRKRICFLPTPLHKLENMSRKYGVAIYMKRDDLTGPSPFGGNKTRKLEFIVGSALQDNIEYLISLGGYQSNSSVQIVSFCRICGLKPILYLADVINQGIPKEHKGNLLLNKIMGSEINYVLKDYEGPDINPLWNKMIELCYKRKVELENQGHKVRVLPSGVVDPEGLVAYVLAFKEIVEQADVLNVKYDYLYHTTGTGGSLPGRDLIFKEINIDQNYFGEGYGIPTEEATLAIRELALEEGLFVDPVYTGKGLSGLLSHIRKGKIPRGSKVVFLHTGGSGALFSEEGLTGALAEE